MVELKAGGEEGAELGGAGAEPVEVGEELLLEVGEAKKHMI